MRLNTLLSLFFGRFDIKSHLSRYLVNIDLYFRIAEYVQIYPVIYVLYRVLLSYFAFLPNQWVDDREKNSALDWLMRRLFKNFNR